MTTNVIDFSDLHVHKWREFATVKDGCNDRLLDTLDVLDLVAKTARKANAEGVLFSGDLIHTRSILGTDVFHLLVDRLRAAVQASGVPWFLMVGNHDQATRDGKLHALASLSGLVTVVDRPSTLLVAGHKVRMVPFRESPDEVEAGINSGGSIDHLRLHVGIDGAVVGSYEAKPRTAFRLNQIPKLGSGCRVLCGHYHRHQTLGGGRAAYIGAPLQHERSDAGTNPGILVTDLDTGTFRLVQNEKAPRFMQLTDSDLSGPLTVVTGNFVDVLLKEEPAGGVEKLRQRLKEVGVRGEPNIVVLPKPEKQTKRLNVTASMSVTQMLEKYVAEFAPDDVDKDEVLRVAKECL
jgi:DNA repair exonuclease SbcCD nuclease subunit